MNKEKRVALRLHKNQLQDLEILAKKHNSNISEQVRKAVEEYISNQCVRKSLSYARKELSKKSMLEKVKIFGGLILLTILIPIIFDVWLGIVMTNPSRVAMTIGFPLALWALFHINVIKKYLGRMLIVAFLILISGWITFQFLPCHHQELFKIFLILFCRYLILFLRYAIGMFIFLFIGVKIYGAKID